MREEENVPLGTAQQVGDAPTTETSVRLVAAAAILGAGRQVAAVCPEHPDVDEARARVLDACARVDAWGVVA